MPLAASNISVYSQVYSLRFQSVELLNNQCCFVNTFLQAPGFDVRVAAAQNFLEQIQFTFLYLYFIEVFFPCENRDFICCICAVWFCGQAFQGHID